MKVSVEANDLRLALEAIFELAPNADEKMAAVSRLQRAMSETETAWYDARTHRSEPQDDDAGLLIPEPLTRTDCF